MYPEAVEGCSVLDLGSGAGIDCFVLSKLVGPSGQVVGVDMTQEQVINNILPQIIADTILPHHFITFTEHSLTLHGSTLATMQTSLVILSQMWSSEKGTLRT